MSAVFYITPQGKYEVHLSVKAPKGQCIATKELAHEVGKCLGRPMIPGQNERPILGNEYASIACVEGAKYQTIQGVARIRQRRREYFRRYIFDDRSSGW